MGALHAAVPARRAKNARLAYTGINLIVPVARIRRPAA
jgi:hypothetical protein